MFCVPRGGPYALSHSVGCLPSCAASALESAFLAPWREQGGDAWPWWLKTIDRFREALADVLGGEPQHYCPQPNLSAALSKLLPCIPRNGERRVLLAAEDSFPSLAYVLQQGERLGYKLRFIASCEDIAHPSTWEKHLTGEVAAALVTHVHSNTGIRIPLAEIAALCRRNGVLCIADIAQSAGVLAVDVVKDGADVVLGSCVKWLCGGPGAGFMWVRPDLIELLEPLDVGWFSHANPFEMDVHAFQYAPDARRFWGGTPSVAPFALAAESLRVLHGIGIAAVSEHNSKMKQQFVDALPPRWAQRLDIQKTGGTLCIPLGSEFDAVTRALRRDGVRFDTRGDRVRLSFHIYNNPQDAERCARAFVTC